MILSRMLQVLSTFTVFAFQQELFRANHAASHMAEEAI